MAVQAQSSGVDNLVAIALLEKDKNADVLLTWSYPLLVDGLEAAVISKVALASTEPHEFVFFRLGDTWIYAHTRTGTFAGLAGITAITVALTSNVFNPEKFKVLGSRLSQAYALSGQPPLVLKAYLAVMSKDEFEFGTKLGGKFATSDYDDRAALQQGSLKDIIAAFGMETAVLYNAVMLKKRVAVYSSKLPTLQQTVRTLPAFAWHRQNWSILRPLVDNTDDELALLANQGVYIAGFLDRSIATREDLFDVFVDVDDRSVAVAAHAKNDFLLGKIHKEIVQALVAAAEDPANGETQLLKGKVAGDAHQGLIQKNKQVLATLETLVDPQTNEVTAESIKAKELPNAVARFYYNLALAEGRASR